MLVFYGLSQAGRAIAAAASGTNGEDAWKLKGHGISSVGLDRNLPNVEVHTGKQGERGSSVRLSELLDSPLWGKVPVRLNELWDILPENETVAAPRHEQPPANTLVDRASRPVPRAASVSQRSSCPLPILGCERPQRARSPSDYLKEFPEAQGYYDFLRGDREPDADPNFTCHHDGWGELLMHWRLPDGQPGTPAERLALLETITRPYKGTLYFFPVVTPNTRSLHPLMAWWAVLHTLSMLARYQPAEWASHINVDTSRHAVAIERLLKEVIRVLPQLVLETIDQIAP